MATPKEITIPSQPIQYNNIGMPYPSQLEKLKEKPQQQAELEKRQKKAAQYGHKRKSIENEKDKQKAELEKSGNELKSLLAQFGSKAKANDELEQDVSKLRGSIANLLTKVQNRGISPQVTATPTQTIEVQLTSESPLNLLISTVFFPITIIRNMISTFYNSINWTVFLTVILLIELAIVGLIWTSRRAHHTYLYVEPYEAVIHGTFGADQSTPWNVFRSAMISVQDFFAEVMKGGRGFGSPSYDGFVPI